MQGFFRRYMALTIKEVQQLRRNRGLIIQLLLPPTIVLVIFGYALNPQVRDLRLGIVDESQTPVSRAFINSLTENVNFTVAQHFFRPEDAAAALNHLRLDAYVVIPIDFDRNIARGQPARVQTIIDAVDANTAQIAQGYLERALNDYNALNAGDPAHRGGIALNRT